MAVSSRLSGVNVLAHLYLIFVVKIYIVMHTHTHTHAHADTHTHTHTHTHTLRVSDEGIGRAVKNSVELISTQARLEGGVERGGRIKKNECNRQLCLIVLLQAQSTSSFSLHSF